MDHADFTVPAMTCGHCVAAVHDELTALPGVVEVTVDLESKAVSVLGSGLSWETLTAAVDEAGYELSR